MENYNIYEEIGRGVHSFVHKARRKRSVEYVAVKSTAKGRMNKILNEVQLLHKLDSMYVLKFHNWYESSNHIWIIFEYCIGGDLLKLIAQDVHLPQVSVVKFGQDLVRGLHYLHQNGIIFCDLKPANVLIDEYGTLKLADFGFARRILIDENQRNNELPPGSPFYMAPELFEELPIHSFASDFWALGCILYEMRTGTQPFVHRDLIELRHMIQTTNLELPPQQFDMTPDFCDLLRGLLVVAPEHRMTWSELVEHTYWGTSLDLDCNNFPPQPLFEARYASMSSKPVTIKPVNRLEVRPSMSILSQSIEALQVRPATAPQKQSSPKNNEEFIENPPRTAPEVPVHFTEPVKVRVQPLEFPTKLAKQRIFTSADTIVVPIVGSNNIEVVSTPRYKEAALPVEPLTTNTDIEAHLEKIYHFLRGDASAAEKHNTLAYLCSIAAFPKLANVIVNSSLMTLLVKLLERSTSSALSTRLCLVLGILVRHAAFIGVDLLLSTNKSALVPVLLGLMSETNVQILRRAIACLGELSFYLSTQPEVEFPEPLLSVLLNSLDAPDMIVRHFAIQSICNILPGPSTNPNVIRAFVVPDVIGIVVEGLKENGNSIALKTSLMQLLSQALKLAPANYRDDFLNRIATILPLVWSCITGDDFRLTIAALNVMNCVIERGESVEPCLTSLISFPTIRGMLQKKEHEETMILLSESNASGGRFEESDEGGRLTNLVHGKLLLLLYFGLQSSQTFALSFVESNVLDDVEKFLVNPPSASASKTYLVHSALQLVSLSVRIALELTFTLANDDPPPALINLFESLLGSQLLRLRQCRDQFMSILHLNTHEEFECFVMGSTELLKRPQMQSTMVHLLHIAFSYTDIVTGSDDLDRLWFEAPLMEITNILDDAHSHQPELLITCIRIIYNAFSMFPPSDPFIIQALFPAYKNLLQVNEPVVIRFATELLLDIIRRDQAYITILSQLKLTEQLYHLQDTNSASAKEILRQINRFS
ncbi:serine/threonine protein kinase [Thraustotheca clavata]|uniref:Serine/threonine protein kinase n=1 Tax=Thraustotheca clavata TaxID=74557 RepID=A0A1V9ZE49_9STRA|nr:serine/threonine protein kinase [Thraustotheca clavata]